MDARSYRVEETLKNVLRVTVRAIRPDDRQAFLQAYQGLERQTIYLRTFGMRGDPSDEEFRRWTDVDFVRTGRRASLLPALFLSLRRAATPAGSRYPADRTDAERAGLRSNRVNLLVVVAAVATLGHCHQEHL
nr:hypothetical protein [Gammaproteobacteria bacterium]